MSGHKEAARGSVLFVDDDPFYRDLARSALIEAGYKVMDAADGTSALALIAANAFDLVVLDIAMPGMSGFEVIERVRGELAKPDLPILVITGHDDTISVRRAYDLGVTSFVAKPLNWLLFVHHVEFVLKAAQSAAELRNASRIAEFMSDLKSRLVGLLVTEFQSPLRAAHGFATLLKQEADGPIVSTLYAQIIGDLYTALDRLNVTHAKMLNFGRTLASGISLNEEVFDLPSTFAGIVASFDEQIARRHLDIVETFTGPLRIEFRGDRALLGQALRALVDNAVRLSRRHGEVAIASRIDDKGNYCLSICDSGPTLSKAQIEDVLGSGPSTRSSGGETLEHVTALKMSKVLIEAHQGTMLMRAITGEGMVTEVILPRSRLLGVASIAA